MTVFEHIGNQLSSYCMFRVIEILFCLLTIISMSFVELCLANYNKHNTASYSTSNTSVVERTIAKESLLIIYFCVGLEGNDLPALAFLPRSLLESLLEMSRFNPTLPNSNKIG